MSILASFSLLTAAATSAAADPNAQPSTTAALLSSLLPFALILVVFYFILIRPQRKKEKQVQAMRNSLEVGDEVVTSGGIIGRVVSIKEDTVVIETGSDRSKIRIKRWAIQDNQTVHDNVETK